jgi:ADP-ribosylation factor related protein 1
MFGLIHGLWKLYFRRIQYQILVIGLDNAGKSTLIEQIRHLYINTPSPDQLKIPPTVGLNLANIDINSNTKFLFWDLGGSQSLRVLWSKYYAECHAVCYVVDSTVFNRNDSLHHGNRIDENCNELHRLLNEVALVDAPLLVLANKQDLDTASTVDSISSILSLSSISNRPCKIIGCSALQGLGVDSALKWLLDVLPSSKRSKRVTLDNGG